MSLTQHAAVELAQIQSSPHAGLGKSKKTPWGVASVATYLPNPPASIMRHPGVIMSVRSKIHEMLQPQPQSQSPKYFYNRALRKVKSTCTALYCNRTQIQAGVLWGLGKGRPQAAAGWLW
jgi:hypothetical protein